MPPARIVIAASFAAEPVRDVLSYLLRIAAIEASLSFSPNHQVILELLEPSSPLAANRTGVNVLLLRLDVVATPARSTQSDDRPSPVMLDQLIGAIEGSARSSEVPWIVVSCPPPPSLLNDAGAAWHGAEDRLVQTLTLVRGVEVVRAADILSPYALRDYYDAYGDARAEIPYTSELFAALGSIVARRIHARLTPPRKVLVLDCDNTLWTGVCGEDGPDAVTIDPPRRDLQAFALELRRKGILLCLCSKNNEADVWDAFDRRTDMLLSRRDFVAWRINWAAKPQNIRELADELQLGLDTFVFIDDDAYECAAVRAQLPDVITVHCPVDRAENRRVLDNLWVFDQAVVTHDDQQRTQRYQHNREREQVRQRATTVDEFVALLDLRVSIRLAAAADVERIAQLTRRVTQFNCTLRRWSERDVSELLERREYDVVSVEASDCYGDYGLVGVLIARHGHGYGHGVLDIETFLLSCRALGRGIERRMLTEAEALARAHRTAGVRLTFVSGPRNTAARTFLEALPPTWRRREISGGCEYVAEAVPLN